MFLIFLVPTAIIFALLEIQIEGINGWASKLPTWKFSSTNPLLSKIFPNNRPLTGYHLYLFTFVFLLVHLWLIFLPWNLSFEINTLVFYLSLIILEDFFWFMFNPSFGLKKFSKKNIPWHSPWILYLPASYWIGIFFISTLLLIFK